MSPYTADAQVLASILSDSTNSLWKQLSGPIENISIVNKREEEGNSDSHNMLIIYNVRITTREIKTDEYTKEAKNITFVIVTKWNFMELINVEVLEPSN